MTIILILASIVLGAVMGSFGLVLLDRWEDLKSVITGRSMCLSCKHSLVAKDLVPLLSYLSTKGKCRYCGVNIPISCPITEMIMAVVFGLTTWRVISTGSDYLIVSLIAWRLINWSLTLMVIHDHNTHYLHWTAWIVSAVVAVGYTIGRHSDILMTSVWSSVILGIVFGLIYLSGFAIHWIKYGTWEEWFGFGDVLMAFIIGRIAPLVLWYDTLNLIGEWGILTLVQLVLWYLVFSSTVGLLYRWWMWSFGNKEVEIAFIPGMVIGFWIYIAIILQFGLFIR